MALPELQQQLQQKLCLQQNATGTVTGLCPCSTKSDYEKLLSLLFVGRAFRLIMPRLAPVYGHTMRATAGPDCDACRSVGLLERKCTVDADLSLL